MYIAYLKDIITGCSFLENSLQYLMIFNERVVEDLINDERKLFLNINLWINESRII